MLKLGNTRASSSAKRRLDGVVSNGATWTDTIILSDDGAEISGASSGEWRLTLRCTFASSADLTLSSGDSELVITQNTDYTSITLDVAPATLANLCGDYHADLVHETTGGDITHWAHGVITVQDDPI